ncbi:DUF397 domain-containing protein [Streptomyces sp900129855]|uniref:DUF397 domain-containing protein n=1 Tax=Streptomyces sp. 900129855 TaxID=3155129 RepID=A0ABV2ZX33_9ACTN
MQPFHWQKSSYSGDSSNCVNIAADPTAPNGMVHLRESDEPEVVLTTTPARLQALICGLKGLKAMEGQVRDTTPQLSSRFSSRL